MPVNTFNPDSAGINNGNYFGLPFQIEEAMVVLAGIPWDVTTSYRSGTSEGPEAIMKASLQVDLFDADFGNIWEKGIATLTIDKMLKEKNKSFRQEAVKAIAMIESGINENSPELAPILNIVNEASEFLNEKVYHISRKILEDGKIPGIVGGEHSVSYGLLKALNEYYDNFAILQIDAHADLRECYEGFKFSHASAMYNALGFDAVKRLVQVGLRDYCEEEKKLADKVDKVYWFDNQYINSKLFRGESWDSICTEIIDQLPFNVYISFDIDGLDPAYCPGTGTPVPGGLTFDMASWLIKRLAERNKKVIGFDLCEVAPGALPDIDALTGARVLYKLCGLATSFTEN